MNAARPFTRTQADGAGDFITAVGSQAMVMVGCRLTGAAGAAATAQVTDANGTILANLSVPTGGNNDEMRIAVVAVGKIALAAIAGAGSSVTVYVQ